MGCLSHLSTQIDNFPHYKIWYTSKYKEDPGSISQVQMNTSNILNAKSELLSRELELSGIAFPSTRTPKLLTIYIVFTVVMMLNYFPVKGGVSTILSPKTIISGEILHYKLHIGLNIGLYWKLHEHEDPSNSQLPQTKETIFIVPSVNEQGEF